MRDALGSVGSVLVVGGASEIGVAVARRLVTGRAQTVVLAGRDEVRMQAAADALRAAGARTVAIERLDVDDVDGHAALVSELWARHGGFDLVVVAAGVLGDEEAARRSGATAAQVLHTNFTGTAAVLVELAERMREEGHGTLVVLSSVAGERVRASNFVYGASKAGLDGFAQGLGDALAGSGVSVLVVRPGFVRTRMTEGLDAAPLATTPEAVAEQVASALRRGAHTVWAPGAMRWVMLALRLLPRGVFRRLPI